MGKRESLVKVGPSSCVAANCNGAQEVSTANFAADFVCAGLAPSLISCRLGFAFQSGTPDSLLFIPCFLFEALTNEGAVSEAARYSLPSKCNHLRRFHKVEP